MGISIKSMSSEGRRKSAMYKRIGWLSFDTYVKHVYRAVVCLLAVRMDSCIYSSENG